MKNLMMGAASLIAVATLIYVLVLRFEVMPLNFSGHPVTFAILTICGATVAMLFWLDYATPIESRSKRTKNQLIPELHDPDANKRTPPFSSLTFVIILVIARTYFSHALFDRAPIWLDAYWMVILLVLLGASALYWGYDSFIAPLKTRVRLGRTPAEIRAVFVVKRIIVLMLTFSILLLSGGIGEDVFHTLAAQAIMSCVMAFLASTVLIAR